MDGLNALTGSLSQTILRAIRETHGKGYDHDRILPGYQRLHRLSRPSRSRQIGNTSTTNSTNLGLFTFQIQNFTALPWQTHQAAWARWTDH